jgi:hypothetical protein
MGCGEAVLAGNGSVPYIFEQSKNFLIQLLFYKESLVHDREYSVAKIKRYVIPARMSRKIDNLLSLLRPASLSLQIIQHQLPCTTFLLPATCDHGQTVSLMAGLDKDPDGALGPPGLRRP